MQKDQQGADARGIWVGEVDYVSDIASVCCWGFGDSWLSQGEIP